MNRFYMMLEIGAFDSRIDLTLKFTVQLTFTYTYLNINHFSTHF